MVEGGRWTTAARAALPSLFSLIMTAAPATATAGASHRHLHRTAHAPAGSNGGAGKEGKHSFGRFGAATRADGRIVRLLRWAQLFETCLTTVAIIFVKWHRILRLVVDAKVQRCKVAKVQGCKGARLQGCKVARLQGCKGAKVQGCKGAESQRYKVNTLQLCNLAKVQPCYLLLINGK